LKLLWSLKPRRKATSAMETRGSVRYYYPDAKDGWYIDAGGTFLFGLVGGVAFGRMEVAGRFGWLRTEHFNDLMPPMYAGVGVGFAY
jgi:hypothetical protein